MSDEQGRDQNVVSNDPHRMRGEMEMVESALRRRWITPDQLPQRLPAEMLRIVIARGSQADGYEYPARIRIAAARVLMQMEGQNQADELSERDNVHTHFHVGMTEEEELRQLERKLTEVAAQRGLIVDQQLPNVPGLGPSGNGSSGNKGSDEA